MLQIANALVILLFLADTSHSIFENCDYFQKLEPDKSYHIFSPGYPNKYVPGVTCRWVAESPPNTRIYLSCDEFDIPASDGCWMSKVAISREGRIDLEDVKYYCGTGTLDVISKANRINVLLLSSWGRPGSFFCSIGVKEVQPTPSSCACGYKNTMRIVGGSETNVNEYPMMAGLVDGLEYELFCGATIISQNYALTAAHCLTGKLPQNVALLVGDHDTSTGTDTDTAQLYLTKSFTVHPQYNTVYQRNDIALVKVKKKIEFNMRVGPVCLPFANKMDRFVGETVYALGWGSTSFTGESSDKLLHVPLNVITYEQCRPTYGNLLTDDQMCTYNEDKDACQSDSGGPLLWTDPKSKAVKLLGIISYGTYCATLSPSVNTRVTSYLDWIQKATGEDFCVM